MPRNEILEELYQIRERLLAEHNGSLADYLRDAAERAKTSNHPIADLPQRQIVRKLPLPVDVDVAADQPPSPAVQR